ncbi:hypothetical protein GmRootV59_53850 (plasmid) [Variovorax sp. V59]
MLSVWVKACVLLRNGECLHLETDAGLPAASLLLIEGRSEAKNTVRDSTMVLSGWLDPACGVPASLTELLAAIPRSTAATQEAMARRRQQAVELEMGCGAPAV